MDIYFMRWFRPVDWFHLAGIIVMATMLIMFVVVMTVTDCLDFRENRRQAVKFHAEVMTVLARQQKLETEYFERSSTWERTRQSSIAAPTASEPTN